MGFFEVKYFNYNDPMFYNNNKNRKKSLFNMELKLRV